ncbi:MAG: hypothetical protein ACYDBT_09310 [Desulfobulbaceae bacterium]
MKLRFTSTMAVVLALFMVSVGFARTQLLVCRYQCEQDRQVSASPCCSGGAVTHHGGDHREAGPAGDCPHVAGSGNFSDFSFTLPTAHLSAAAAVLAGAVFVADPLQPAFVSRVEKLPANTSPPGLVTPPLYHLYCSLLF